ncbi:cyclin-domain fused to serine-threonine kinase [Acanthamoeba polyphaga moumouvirus]|uniref:Cyclin-domain fused to serine-threonine kinase n=1 Tax=Acanthamoeba polyphaga moumouvirus TaxID=1269028 RepID=L7RDA8_9VIRU|nr:cyclin-domain fused to serine-threonine kinase [Acanthamoeba polyphaga moumouvirus]AGC02271.1 cyclin-domain fused to serine-threonine kinase [Acanthamoeba polyphaga moumouvirus]
MNIFINQNEINQNMRSICVDWLVSVEDELEFKSSTTNLAITLMDRYIFLENNISKKNLQAIAICCMNLASKLNETMHIGINQCAYYTADIYVPEYLAKLEYEILKTLNFDVYKPILFNMLRLIRKEINCSLESSFFSNYLTYVLLITTEYLYFNPKKLANHIVKFAIKIKEINNNNDLESFINSNIYYQYIFTMWNNYRSGKLNDIQKKYEHCRFKQISKTPIPKINCHYNLNHLPKKIHKSYNTNLNYNIKVYSYKDISRMNKIKDLGKGTFGIVEHMRYNDKDIALKYLKCPDEIDAFVVREICNMNHLNHKNILQIHGVYYNYYKNQFSIGLELASQSLYNKIYCEEETISESCKSKYILQFLSGIKYMHKHEIMHRDLSLNNILITFDENLKICDFGQSKIFYQNISAYYSSGICTYTSRAIELFFDYPQYNEKIDIWSCACIIGIILNGDNLFNITSESDAKYEIFKILGSPKDLDYITDEIPEYERIGFTELESKYPNETMILYKMLDYDPNKRISASEALTMFKNLYNN